MTLKPQLDKTPVPVTPPPAWGDLAEPGEPVGAIRFECKDGAYSYPYHALSRWVLQAGQRESLVIDAGQDRVTVLGRRLEIVRNELDAGRVRVLRSIEERYVNSQAGAIVTDVTIERSNREA